MLLSGLNEAGTGISLQSSIVLALIFAPLILGGAIFVRHHSGMAILSAEGVHLRRPGRQHYLPYTAITALQSRTNPFTPALRIHGKRRTLHIPRTLEHFPYFYQALLAHVAPSVRAAALGQPATISGTMSTDAPLYTLHISRRMRVRYGIAVVLFVGLYLFLGSAGLWSTTEPRPLSPEGWRSAFFFFALISVVFLPALIFVLYSLFTRYGPRKIEQPAAWEFYPDRLRYRFFRGLWSERPACDVQHITLEPLTGTVRGGRGIEQKMTIYMLVLEFNDGQRLVIGQERAVQFGETLEQLYVIIKELYE
jgi:hypothetical protein